MKNRIERELKKTNLPCLAFYKLSETDIKISTSGLTFENFDMMVNILKQNKELLEYLELVVDTAQELRNN